jgi:hypothetical protein
MSRICSRYFFVSGALFLVLAHCALSQQTTTAVRGSAVRKPASAQNSTELAAYYFAQVEKTGADLAREEQQMSHWAGVEGMADRTKVPNPYASAKTLVTVYQEKLTDEEKLAAQYQKMVASTQGQLVSTE